jgi:2-oxo-4-hydroxy-4-carboxy-5-ureidoimidazoline decarboxylase
VSVAARLDRSPDADAMLRRCCGAQRWVEGMLARRPFGDDATLLRVADEVWATMGDEDVLEALSHHPEIGGDLDRLREKWAGSEQSGVDRADEATLVALRDGNVRYRETFGHIFVVCATGKSAARMLALLQARLGNDPAVELAVAAAEQAEITKLRLEKL